MAFTTFSSRFARRLYLSSSNYGPPSFPSLPCSRQAPYLRLLCSGVSAAISKEEATALDMIKYSQSLKRDDDEATRVLEQGLSFFSGDGLSSAIAASRVQLALATLYVSRSSLESAAECLEKLLSTKSAFLQVKGAALEALIGLDLQMHDDEAAFNHMSRFVELLKDVEDSYSQEDLQVFRYQAVGSNKLVNIVRDLAVESKEDIEPPLSRDLETALGSSILASAEYFHVHGSSSLAKDFYERAVEVSKKQLAENCREFSAAAMVPDEVHVGALAGLGQLLTSMGDFEEAESRLTEALKHAEKVKGEKHPQVGMILSCIGNLYHWRGVAQGHNNSLISEGLYKRALDLMKTPPLDKEIMEKDLFVEIMALTRARLGVTLASSPHRQSEVKKLQAWSEGAWKTSKPLPIVSLLGKDTCAGSSKTVEWGKSLKEKYTLVEVRFGRVFPSQEEKDH